MFPWLARALKKPKETQEGEGFSSSTRQLRSWHKANRKMGWDIEKMEFQDCPPMPDITQEERRWGYTGCALCYGFGDDGNGNADPVLSGKMAWDYALKTLKQRTWQCEYVKFDDPAFIRLRPGAPPRPHGFYWVKVNTGKRFIDLTVSGARKLFRDETGFGPEGLQFLIMTHPHFRSLMNEREHPFMAIADYDVAPYGHFDFFDAVQVFVSYDTLGLGIGNVDRNYPFFGIPSIRF